VRPLTNSEKMLLAVLVGVLFFGGNFFGYKWLSQQQSHLQLTAAQLKADQADAQVDLAQLDTWTKRQAWIKEHEPTLGDEGDAKAQVLQTVLKGARDNNLEIQDQSLGDTKTGVAGTAVSVKVKVKGSMESLCHWLTDLQKPEQFYAVSTFSLKLDQDQKSFICSLEVVRYFKGGS